MDRLSKEHRSWNMSHIKGKNTGPEVAMRSMLHRDGFRFRLQDRRLPSKPDIILPKYRTAIFVHGCFWHRHQNCKYSYLPKSNTDFWEKKFQRTIQRDAEHLSAMSKMGWLSVIVWECEIKKNPVQVMNRVREILQRRFMEI
jgi:DNA mismatch endonuclease (patch repair protein)